MKIIRSKNIVTFDKVGEENASIANIDEVVMDKEFIEQFRHDWCWLSAKNLPQGVSWYRVDRADAQLKKISFEEAKTLEWHERLYVYGSAIAAADQKMPLALYVGDEYSDGRLSALYLCGPDVLTWVAQKTS